MRTYQILFGFALGVFLLTPSLAQESREITKTVSLKPDGRVSVDTYKGTITVLVWDKPSVEIHARIEADDSYRDKYSEEKVRETEILIDNTETSVRIKTDYDNVRKHGDSFFSLFDDTGSLPLVHYTITMPATADLRVKDFKSRTTIAGLRSTIDLNTYKGSAELSDLTGSLQLETYKGDARVGFTKFSDRSRIKTYKGNLTITVPKSLGFEVDADLGYKTDFHSDFELHRYGRTRRHGNLEYREPVNGGGPLLVLRSTKGSVALRGR
ncbi:MAG TPA: DUF4097 family beta strand repeat-containing protein [Bacteroidota bacterium]|nr:DUF4097 family beta strand repeat-containing protein [Bacteroidota bacterium]